MASPQFKLPWVFGVKRPAFVFYRIRMAIPTTVPTNLIYLGVFLGVFYIFMGGVYDLVNDDVIAFGSDQQGNPLLWYPSQDRQFLIEGIVAALVEVEKLLMRRGVLYQS